MRGFIIFRTGGRDVYAVGRVWLARLIDRHSEIAASVIGSWNPIRRRLRRHISHPSHNSANPFVAFVNLFPTAASPFPHRGEASLFRAALCGITRHYSLIIGSR